MAQYAEKRHAFEKFNTAGLYRVNGDHDATRASLASQRFSGDEQNEQARRNLETFDFMHGRYMGIKKEFETLSNTIATLNESHRSDTVRLNALSKSRDEALSMMSA